MRTELGDTAGALYAAKILHRSCQASSHADEDTKSVVLASLRAAHFGQGEYTEAKQVQHQAVRRFEELYGADHESTLQARENLANTVGQDAPESLEIVEGIGNCLFRLGRLSEAEATYLYVAARRKVVLGKEHPDTLDARRTR